MASTFMENFLSSLKTSAYSSVTSSEDEVFLLVVWARLLLVGSRLLLLVGSRLLFLVVPRLLFLVGSRLLFLVVPRLLLLESGGTLWNKC